MLLAIGLVTALMPGMGLSVAHAQNLLIGKGGDGGTTLGHQGGGGGGGIGGGGGGGLGNGLAPGVIDPNAIGADGGGGGGLSGGFGGLNVSGKGGDGGQNTQSGSFGYGGMSNSGNGGGGGAGIGGGGGVGASDMGFAGTTLGGVVNGDGTNVSGLSAGAGGGSIATTPVTFTTSRTYIFAGIGGGGGGGGATAGGNGTDGALVVNGTGLAVTRSMLVGGGGGGGGINNSITGGNGGNGTLSLTNSATLNIGEVLLIGGSGGGGGEFRGVGGNGGTGTVSVDASSSISIGPGGYLVVGGFDGMDGGNNGAAGGAGGIGTLNLAGNLTFNGGASFLVNAGSTFNVGGATAGGSTVGTIAGLSSATNNGIINFNQTNSVTFAAGIAGTGMLTQNGSTGTTILTGANTYTGGTTINGGTLQIGNGGTTGSLAGNVTDNGTLAFNRSDSSAFSGMISGNGRLTQIGSGTTILTGENSYTGGTTISAGTLQIGDGGTSGAITGNVTDNGTLAFNKSDDMVFTGVISGSGAVRQAGSGTLLLFNTNSYTGGTQITGGTLAITADGALGAATGTLAFSNGATLATFETFSSNRAATLNMGGGDFSVADGKTLTWDGAIGGSGGLTKSSDGTLVLTGFNSYSGGTAITGGTLQVSADNNLGAATGPLALSNGAALRTTADIAMSRATTLGAGGGTFSVDPGTTLAMSGVISGDGGLTKLESGTLLLTGDNTYTGGTTLNGGTLQLGDGTTNGSITGNIVNRGLLVFNSASDTSQTFAGEVTGNGLFRKSGAGTLILTGDSTFSGFLEVSAGRLQIGNGGTTGSISSGFELAGGTTLAFNRSDTLTVTGLISGPGDVEQIGSGVTVLMVNGNSYGGATRVLAGTLRAGGANTLSVSSVISVSSGATLDTNGFDQTLVGLNNAGTVQIGADLTPGLNTTTLSQSGPGAALNITGDYVGQGGSIRLNTYLGGDGSASDRLVLDGGHASGSTLLDITNAGGPGALTTGDGIMVVQSLHGGVTNTGSDDTSTFRLAHRVAAGAYEYALHANGVTDTNDQNWYLRTITATPPSAPVSGGGGGINVPRPEVTTNTAIQPLATHYGYAMLGSLDERGNGLASATLGKSYEERSVWCNGGTAQNLDAAVNPNERYKCTARSMLAVEAQTRWVQSGWLQAVGGHGSRDGNNFFRDGPDYDYTFGGIKTGLDVFAREQADGTLDKAGIYVGYGRVSSNVYGLSDTYTEQKAGTVDMNAYTVGGYWTHYAPEGWYADAAVQGTWYSNSAKSVLNETSNTDGFGIISSLEGGYEFKLGSGWALTPQIQAVYESVSFDNAADSFGIFRFQDGESLRGRLGTRLARTWNTGDEAHPLPVTAWTRINVWHDFISNTKTSVVGFNGENPLSTPSSLKGTWGEIGVGVGARISSDISLYVTGDYQHSLDGQDIRGWNGKAGMNIKW